MYLVSKEYYYVSKDSEKKEVSTNFYNVLAVFQQRGPRNMKIVFIAVLSVQRVKTKHFMVAPCLITGAPSRVKWLKDANFWKF